MNDALRFSRLTTLGSPVALALSCYVFGCSVETTETGDASPDEAFIDEVELAIAGECSTTSQCRGIYGSRAVDCSNSGGGVCLCGSERSVCSSSSGAGGSPSGTGGSSSTSCSGDSACSATQFCNVNAGRVCSPDRVDGSSCSRNAQCLSNACVSGVCQASSGGGTGGSGSGGSGSGGGTTGGLRIAYSADGDYADADDWGASPVSLAMLAQAGKKDALVHFDYCSNPRTNYAAACAEEEESVLGAQSRFGYSAARFFNDDEDLSGAITSLKNAVNASSATSPLYLIVAGPMEVPYRALKAANASAREHVILVSHSTWNQNHTVNGSKRYIDIWNESLVGRAIVRKNNSTPGDEDLPDQNPGFKKPESEWRWIESAPSGAWVFERIQHVRNPGCSVDGITVCSQGDASDAGMMYFVLTGDKNGSVAKLRTFYGL